jgi:endonuclease G
MLTFRSTEQSYEVIGNPSPSISVPTHWSKVILALRAPRGMDPRKTTEREVSLAGFVMPNAVIPDNAPLESFLVPGTSCCVTVTQPGPCLVRS